MMQEFVEVSDKSEVIIIKGCLELNVRFGNYSSNAGLTAAYELSDTEKKGLY